MKYHHISIAVLLLATSCSVVPNGTNTEKPSKDSVLQGRKNAYMTQGSGGVSGYKHVRDYSVEALEASVNNQLSIVVSDKSSAAITRLGNLLRGGGYGVKFLPPDMVVITLPEKGANALRKHASLLEKIENVNLVFTRMPVKVESGEPNDYYYDTDYQQYYLDAINAPRAWTYPQLQETKVKVAVIDTGVTHELDHPLNAIDHDELLGRVESYDTRPTNMLWESLYPGGADYIGHGTKVIGLIAASSNNDAGISAVARLSPANGGVLFSYAADENGSLFPDNTRAAMLDAIKKQCKVVNCSFGHFGFNAQQWYWEDAVAQAERAGVVVVCSAGNEDRYATDHYPSGFPNPNVVSVGAVGYSTNKIFTRWAYPGTGKGSTYGPSVDLMAPGEFITSIDRHNAFSVSIKSGTSYAAPIVTAAVASLWSACSALPYWQVMDVIFGTATKPSAYFTSNGWYEWNQEMGHGVLNFGAAADFLLGSGLIYQWLNPTTGTHGWSQFPDDAVPVEPQYEKIAWQLPQSQLPGTVPFYRCYRSTASGVVRTLTTDPSTANRDGWTVEWPIGYIGWPSSNPAYQLTTPLFWLHKGDQVYFTKSAQERGNLVSQGWYNDWGGGKVGYVW